MRRNGSIAIVLGALALAAGVAYAAIPGADGVISACYDKNGQLRVIDAEGGDTCAKAETPLSWNQTGPPGPPGPSDAYVTRTLPLSPLVDNSTETLRTFAVPAGSYLVEATMRIRVGLPVDDASLFCELYAGQNQLDTFSAFFRASDQYRFVSHALVGWFDAPATRTIKVQCRANYVNAVFAGLGAEESPVVATRVANVTEAP